MHQVPTHVTAIFAVMLVAMILCLAFEEKIHAKKSVIVGLFAVAALFLAAFFALVHPETVEILGHAVRLPVYIPGVDWEVIAIILGSSIFVDVTSKSGLFTWMAIRLTKLSGGDPLRLLIYYGVMTVVFSAVLNNVTAMIIVGALSGVSLGKLGRLDKLLGFLLIEGLLTNVGGLLTLISSVPNIIVGNAAGISFVTFFLNASPYVVVATVATIWLGVRLFDIRPLASEAARAEARGLVAGLDENDGVESRGFLLVRHGDDRAVYRRHGKCLGHALHQGAGPRLRRAGFRRDHAGSLQGNRGSLLSGDRLGSARVLRRPVHRD